MTNYNKFPYWRAYYGIVIKFSEYSYSWCSDTKTNRTYLATSDYLRNAEGIYLLWFDKWYSVEEYKEFCMSDNYNKLKTEAIQKYKENRKIN